MKTLSEAAVRLVDMEIITSRDLAENRGWPRRRPRPHEASDNPEPARLDCGTCAAPREACGDCVMGVLLQIDAHPAPGSAPGLGACHEVPGAREAQWLTPEEQWLTPEAQWLTPEDQWLTPEDQWLRPAEQWLTPEEQRAVTALSAAGMLPPVRHQAVG